MPSPVGHSLIGFTVYRASARLDEPFGWRKSALYLFAANAPDLDFIPGLFIGEPNRFHHGPSHSLAFAALFGLSLGLVLHTMKIDSIRRGFPILVGLYLSHIGLDCLSIDTAAPYGMPLFWPMSETYYKAGIAFLPDIRRSNSATSFVISLFSAHNFRSVAAECVLFLPLVPLVLALKRGSRLFS